MERNRPKLDLPLTRTGKLLEIAGYTLLIALWIITIVVFYSSPEIIPIHYNLEGKADGFGNRGFVFLTTGIATFVFFILTIVLRVPHSFNYLVTITKENAEEQYRRAQNVLRVVRLLGIGMMLGISVQTSYSSNHKLGAGFIILELLSVVVMPIAIVIYSTSKKQKSVG